MSADWSRGSLAAPRRPVHPPEREERAVARETAYIGFVSNQGDRLDYCDRAVTLLGLLPHSQLIAVSSLYETEPIVDERTNPGTDLFLNGVVCLETEIAP